jgi:hypothetical protein
MQIYARARGVQVAVDGAAQVDELHALAPEPAIHKNFYIEYII